MAIADCMRWLGSVQPNHLLLLRHRRGANRRNLLSKGTKACFYTGKSWQSLGIGDDVWQGYLPTHL